MDDSRRPGKGERPAYQSLSFTIVLVLNVVVLVLGVVVLVLGASMFTFLRETIESSTSAQRIAGARTILLREIEVDDALRRCVRHSNDDETTPSDRTSFHQLCAS